MSAIKMRTSRVRLSDRPFSMIISFVYNSIIHDGVRNRAGMSG